MIILRKGEKGSYKYLDTKNKDITDPEVVDYIKKLVIPPNYDEVKIY